MARVHALSQVTNGSIDVLRGMDSLTCDSWYAEDCEQLEILQQLHRLNKLGLVCHFSSMLVTHGNSATTKGPRSHRPTSLCILRWCTETRTTFDPFDAMTRPWCKQLECPKCHTRVYVRGSSPLSEDTAFDTLLPSIRE